jgi:YVTN family beta-propeller protein
MRLFVSNGDAETVTVVNAPTGSVERVIPVSGDPRGIRFTPDARLVYVACGDSGEVAVLDADDGHVRDRFAVRGRPRSVAFSPDGSRAILLSESTGELLILDAHSGRVRAAVRLPEGSRPRNATVRRDGKRIFVTNGEAGTVTVHDRDGSLLRVIRVGPRPRGLALSPDQKLLYVANGPSNEVSVVDLSSYREIDRLAVGQGPSGVAAARTPEPDRNP